MAVAVSPTIMGTIGVSPGNGLNPASAMAPRKYRVFSRSLSTSSGWCSSCFIAPSALAATVGGNAFEKSWGRDRWVSMSHRDAGPATKPPAAPPSALPSVEVMMSTSPSTP